MAKYTNDLRKVRKRQPSFTLKSSRDAMVRGEDHDPVQINYYGGVLDWNQDQECREAAERQHPEDPSKRIWSVRGLKFILPMVILEHETTDWNLEVLDNVHVEDEGWKVCPRRRDKIVEHVHPNDLADFADHLYKTIAYSHFGIHEEDTMEFLNRPLANRTTESSPENEERPSTTTSTESPSTSHPTPFLIDAVSPGHSEESPSLAMVE